MRIEITVKCIDDKNEIPLFCEDITQKIDVAIMERLKAANALLNSHLENLESKKTQEARNNVLELSL